MANPLSTFAIVFESQVLDGLEGDNVVFLRGQLTPLLVQCHMIFLPLEQKLLFVLADVFGKDLMK